MALSDEQIDRYSRQILVPEIGGRGQERLLRSTVAHRGHCATTAVAVDYLSAAGITVAAVGPNATAQVAANLILVVGHDPGITELAPGAETALVLVEESQGAVWFSRSTTTGHCAACTIDCGRETARDRAELSGLSSADVAGAALAVDVIFELLGLPASPEPGVVVFSAGGTSRHDRAIDFSHCRHAAESARIAS